MDNERIGKVADYAREHIRLSAERSGDKNIYAGPDYRWQHTLRVSNYGKMIAEAEHADVELVVAACLLHDSEWFSDMHGREHGRVAAKAIRPFLGEIGYTPDQVENICYSVAVHVDGKADFEHPDTLEAKIVSDADNVDRFGAYRVFFQCLDHLQDYERLIGNLTERIKKLEDYRQRQVLETQAGNALFNQQLQLQIDFYKSLLQEHELTRMPW